MNDLFTLDNKIAVITGGTGILGMALAKGLADAGASVAIIGRQVEKLNQKTAEMAELGHSVVGFAADVTSVQSIEHARKQIENSLGTPEILINCAGGNQKEATINPDGSFFDLNVDAYRRVIDLNLTGTVIPCKVFGREMGRNGKGSIINVSSMSASRPISRVVGYGNAKAGIENFTKWLSTELIMKYGAGLRVNAIAPGFFLTEQNKSLLTNSDGSYTNRAQTILTHTPMERFGQPEDLIGTALWLSSEASKYVSGVVVPVDGGFSAYSGI